MCPRPPPPVAGPVPPGGWLTQEDILEVMSSKGGDDDAIWDEAVGVMAGYGLARGPAEGNVAYLSRDLTRRVSAVAKRDKGYWRAVPQAVHELTGGRATPRDMYLVTTVFVLADKDREKVDRIVFDMRAAAAEARARRARRGGTPPPG